MRPILLALCLASVPALASPLASTEASVHLGGYSSGVGISSADTATGLALVDLGGRWVRGAFVLDGFAAGSIPVGPAVMPVSYLAEARAGVALAHVTALLGASAQLAPGNPAPLQLLPSFTVEAGTSRWRGVLALNDRSTPELLRVGVEYERYSISYLPTLGLEATARVPIRGPWQLDLRGHAFTLLGARSYGLVAGLVWAPGDAR